MSRFREELSVIPRTAWIVASVICSIIAIGVCVFFGAKAPDMRDPWSIVMLGWAFVVIALFGIFVLLLGYVNGDARRRGMPYVLWTLLAIFVPNGIGIILYFVLREKLPRPCSSCGTGCSAGLAYCANCGAAVVRTCPQCKCPVEESWKNCAHCGVAVRAKMIG